MPDKEIGKQGTEGVETSCTIDTLMGRMAPLMRRINVSAHHAATCPLPKEDNYSTMEVDGISYRWKNIEAWPEHHGRVESGRPPLLQPHEWQSVTRILILRAHEQIRRTLLRCIRDMQITVVNTIFRRRTTEPRM
jgi:hypothetical protein